MAQDHDYARPSMADVGRVANVSAQTVSRYFTGVGYVSDATRARITAAVEELGYIPNRTARNLRAERTDSIGVLLVGALNFGSSNVLRGIGRGARSENISVVITQLDLEDQVAEGWETAALTALEHFLAIGVDGIILSSAIPGVERVLEGWSARTAVVTVAEAPGHESDPRASDSYRAAYEACRHLISLGHREIAHIAGPPTRVEAHKRERGYADAMTEAGLQPLLIAHALDWGADSGFRAGLQCDPGAFSAVVAANDEIALGFMHALEARGLRAPHDYSIVGIDDMAEAVHFSPPLTTMRLDFLALGEATYRRLRSLIIGGEIPTVPHEPRLIVRESTRAL
jgi:DNA-binding LacI/PurR family transcriptional regulator